MWANSPVFGVSILAFSFGSTTAATSGNNGF
jgi:hypothetical protein